MNLTDRDKEIIKAHLDRGEPLPARYKLALFEDPPEVELVWQGKTSEVTNVVLPFQSIENIDEPRAEAGEQLGLFSVGAGGRQSGGWTNKLFWGDNKLVLSSLKNGPLRREIEEAGGLKLIYIDPPFDVDADFSVDLEVGEDTLTKEPSFIEELAYRDTWGKHGERYPNYLYERLTLMRNLLAVDGSIFVHVDWRVNGYIRLMLDELFGRQCHVNEIIWCFSHGAKSKKKFGRKHQNIFWYSRNEDGHIFNSSTPDIRVEMKSGKTSFGGRLDHDEDGRAYRLVYGTKNAQGETKYYKYYLDEGKVPEDYWTDINSLQSGDDERVEYATQKPEALLKRIIAALYRDALD